MEEGFLHDLNRIERDLVPALNEIEPTDELPVFGKEYLSDQAFQRVSEMLLPRKIRQRLLDAIVGMEDGMYLYREVVGFQEKATRHAHDFVLEISNGNIYFYFVDPEHSMGKGKKEGLVLRRGDLRPKVNILFATSLTSEGEIDRVSLLRYRADAISHEMKRLHKNREQLAIARSLIRDGALPDFLEDSEQNITFRLDMRPDDNHEGYDAVVQVRSVNDTEAVEKMIDRLLLGMDLPPQDPLEGYLERYRAIMRTHFLRHIESGEYTLLS